MQALSILNDNMTLKFNAIVNLVKNIAQILNDNVEADIFSTKESDRYFASLLNEKEREQQNMNEIVRVETENVEIIDFIPPNVPSEEEIRKRNRQDKENFIQIKLKIERSDPETIEKINRENNERLIRGIVDQTDGLTVNHQI